MKILPYAIPALVLLLLDILWINIFMGAKYESMVMQIQGKPLRFKSQYALLAYICMTIGLYVFVLPVRVETTLKTTLARAALFGAMLYGVFDFTNASVFDKFDINLALIDIMWGSFLYATASASYFLI